MKIDIPDFTDQTVEQRIIETLIRNGSDAYEEINEIVTDQDFYFTAYKECYRILKKHFDNDDPFVDRGVLASELQNTSIDFDLFYPKEIEQWQNLDINTSNLKDLSIILKETSVKRSYSRLLARAGNALTENKNKSSEDLKDEIMRVFLEIEENNNNKKMYRHELQESIKETCKDIANDRFGVAVPTGFKYLDEKFGGGYFPNSLNVICAGTNMGKSIFSNQILLNMIKSMGAEMSEDEKPVILFTMEMDHQEISQRAMSYFLNIKKEEIKKSLQNPDSDAFFMLKNKTKITCSTSANGTPRLIIYDKSDLTIKELKTFVYEEARRYGGIKCVCVDYLQFMTVNPKIPTSIAFGDVAKELKTLAQFYHIPVIAVCQANRNSEDNEIPKNSDIGESVFIERTANTILFIKNSKIKNIKRLFVTKNRNEEKFAFETQFWGMFSRFDTESAREISFETESKANVNENTTRKAGQGFSYGCGNSTYNNYNKTH